MICGGKRRNPWSQIVSSFPRGDLRGLSVVGPVSVALSSLGKNLSRTAAREGIIAR